MDLLSTAHYKSLPWKNGRGVTVELMILPKGANFASGTFSFRVSCASVQENGPFSQFPEHNRVLVVVHGNGLKISHDQGKSFIEVKPLEPYMFDGEWDTRCELVDGPIKDFNVFYKKNSGWNPKVAVLQLTADGSPHLVVPNSFLHVLTGEIDVTLFHTNEGSLPERQNSRVKVSQEMSVCLCKQAHITCGSGATVVVVNDVIPIQDDC